MRTSRCRVPSWESHFMPAESAAILPNSLADARRLWAGWPSGATALVWGVIITIVCLRAFLAPTRQTVLPVYPTAAQNWLGGDDIYRAQPPLDIFLYAPLGAILFGPLS